MRRFHGYLDMPSVTICQPKDEKEAKNGLTKQGETLTRILKISSSASVVQKSGRKSATSARASSLSNGRQKGAVGSEALIVILWLRVGWGFLSEARGEEARVAAVDSVLASVEGQTS